MYKSTIRLLKKQKIKIKTSFSNEKWRRDGLQFVNDLFSAKQHIL